MAPALCLVKVRTPLVLGGRALVPGDVGRVTRDVAETLAARGRVQVLSVAPIPRLR